MPKAQGQFIVKQTPEHAIFCQITGEMFKISKDKSHTIDDIAKNVNIYLTNNNYPLWSINSYIENEMHTHEYKDALILLVEYLCEFVNPEAKIGRERTKVAEDIYNIYCQHKGIDGAFSEILKVENMRKGMVYYIGWYKPELVQITNRLEIESKEYLELLNKKLSSDSSYLWQIGDTNAQIDNLYTDLKLIFDINRLLSTKQNTFTTARAALVEKLNSIKIPHSLLVEFRPDLALLMTHLQSIKDNVIVNKAETASLIANMADAFQDFYNGQFSVFSSALHRVLGSKVDEDEVNHLYNNVPPETLFKTTDDFHIVMRRELEKFRKSKKTLKMKEAWKKAAISDNPNSWSREHGIPILCLFTQNSLRAQKVFDALNGSTFLPDEQKIDEAIEFLQSKALDVLDNKLMCEQEFIQYFCGEYSYIIESSEELRSVIRSKIGPEVYDWYARIQECSNAVKSYLEGRYKQKYRLEAKKKIGDLSAAEAQKYLEELIDKDSLLGIRILKG